MNNPFHWFCRSQRKTNAIFLRIASSKILSPRQGRLASQKCGAFLCLGSFIPCHPISDLLDSSPIDLIAQQIPR
jgi:hypothetical protein